jgi:ligand-binding sensor domain-containing protein
MNWLAVRHQLFTFEKVKSIPLRCIFYTVMILHVLCAGVMAQHQYLFDHLGKKDGLLNESVFAVQQDKKGYIWISSYNSLQRYDGWRFVNFYHNPDDPLSIPAGGIRGMQMDTRNRLWLITSKNILGYLDVNSFRFTEVKLRYPKTVTDKQTPVLHLDKTGNVILIFPGRDFATYNEAAGEVAVEYNPFQLPAGWGPSYFWQDDDLNYWIGSRNGLLKYNSKKKLFCYRGHNAENDPVIKKYEDATNVVFAYMDHRRTFWIIGWPEKGLFINSYTLASDSVIAWHPLISKTFKKQYHVLHGIVEMKDGTMWMAGQNLFAKADAAKQSLQPVYSNAAGEYSIRYDDIRQLYEDREKNIWVSTNKGLYRFNPSAQLMNMITNRLPGIDSIYTADVTDFLQTPDGEILVATWGNGTFCYDNNFTPIRSKYVKAGTANHEAMVWCITRRNNGDIWRGLQAGVLFIDEAATGKTIQLNPPVFSNSTIRQIEEDNNGNMWLGTQRGDLIKWDHLTKSFSVQHQFKAIISRIYIDQEKYVWVCTDINGVYRINPADGSIVASYSGNGPVGKALRSAGASDIIQYNDSVFVISGEGLNLLNKYNSSFKYFNTANGLGSDNVSNVIADKAGYIWMSSDAGILSYHPGRRKKSLYEPADGVHTTDFSVAASTTLRDGRILFGTHHDILCFDPANVTVADFVPPVVDIAGFLVMNKRLPVDSLLKLSMAEFSYVDHSLVIELSTLTYQNQYQVCYMMEGLEKDWIDAPASNIIAYNYLPAGKYKFKTACRDGRGQVGSITSISIYIKPPFWKSMWFYGALLLFAGGLFYWLDHERMKRKEAIERMRNNIADNLHQEVNTALNNINLLSEMAKMKADKEPQKSKEFIGQIHSKSNNMIIAMDDMLWAISPENDGMQKTVERMQEFIEGLNKEYNTDIQMAVDKKIATLKLDMQFRHEVFLLFKALVSSLQKAGAADCKLHVGTDRNSLLYSVEFNNSHCDLQHLNRLSESQDMQHRLAASGAALQTTMHASHCSIAVKIPLR